MRAREEMQPQKLQLNQTCAMLSNSVAQLQGAFASMGLQPQQVPPPVAQAGRANAGVEREAGARAAA